MVTTTSQALGQDAVDYLPTYTILTLLDYLCLPITSYTMPMFRECLIIAGFECHILDDSRGARLLQPVLVERRKRQASKQDRSYPMLGKAAPAGRNHQTAGGRQRLDGHATG